MNRVDEINNFLIFYANYFKQHPEVQITPNLLYSALVVYGVPNEHQRQDMTPYFNSWQQQFVNSNLNVYESPQQKYFLQFRNTKDGFNPECVKIYVPFKLDNMYNNVNKLFNFIEQNDMETYSKVSQYMRSDAVVLRMSNMDDARQVIDYINTNFDVNEFSVPNPFVARDGFVGISYDGLLSYNSVVSLLLANYFDTLKQSNRLNEADLKTLQQYIKQSFEDIFVNHNKLASFMNTTAYKEDRFSSDADSLANYCRVFNMIQKSLDENATSKECLDFIETCQQNGQNHVLEQHFSNVLVNMKTNKTMSVVDEYIRHAAQKYGPQNVSTYLMNYIMGNHLAITRDNDFRQKFDNPEVKSYVQQIPNLEQYIGEVCQEQILYNACIKTYEKYGPNQVYEALRQIKNGNYKLFTNDNESRTQLINHIKPEQVEHICQNILFKNQVIVDYDMSTAMCELIGSRLNIEKQNQK